MARELVAYRRVSTQKQGESGLGLEAQEAAIQAYERSTGLKIIAAFTEVETGKRDEMENRPELLKAIARAKRAKATLVIAKLDRLARSVYVTATLHKAGVEFVACDNPTANRLTINILAAVAEDEAKRISQRTKDALAAYKAGRRVSKSVRAQYPNGVPAAVAEATGGKLGASLPQCRNLTPVARALGSKRSAEARKKAAIAAVEDLAPQMLELRKDGASLAGIAARLNADGQLTRVGSPWSVMQVKRVLARSYPDIIAAGLATPARVR
jgi:DNA invertase Pin-like site-specific DNA recombinase